VKNQGATTGLKVKVYADKTVSSRERKINWKRNLKITCGQENLCMIIKTMSKPITTAN
jgi:hypothetical protein